jgi:hypothetical protein
MIMEALTIWGGMPRDEVAIKLISYRADDVNVFQGTLSLVSWNKFMMIMHNIP